MNYTLDDMIAVVVEYMECAGFADYYERVVSHWSEDQIKENFDWIVKEDPYFLEMC